MKRSSVISAIAVAVLIPIATPAISQAAMNPPQPNAPVIAYSAAQTDGGVTTPPEKESIYDISTQIVRSLNEAAAGQTVVIARGIVTVVENVGVINFIRLLFIF